MSVLEREGQRSRIGVNMERAGTNSVEADWVPNVIMCVAVKSGFEGSQKVMAAEYMGVDIGSWWACAAYEVKAIATPLVFIGK